MKRKKFWYAIRRFLFVYCSFFILCGFVVTVSFFLFFQFIEMTEEQVRAAAPLTFYNILFITATLTIGEAVRHRIAVERPAREILAALHKITAGDFTVRMPEHAMQAEFAEIVKGINTMTEELSGVETLRTDFIADVSHEMKTPLAVIGNYGTLLQDPNLSPEKRMEYAKTITVSARSLAEMMTNILRLNRLDNQQIYPDMKSYDLSEQLCECLLQFESRWEEKEINVQTDLAEDVTITADGELLALVWNNLLSNAFKFTPRGGTVSVSLKADGEDVVVAVSDTGCGISKESGQRIFEKFYQADRSHAPQGNGLGLALVKRVIDITGGSITVDSKLGVGSTFTVRLRREPHDAD